MSLIIGISSVTQVYAESYVTRAETVTLLFSTTNTDVSMYTGSITAYPDVLPNTWYAQYMYAAVQTGLIDSESRTGLLYPHRSVTRAQFLKMVTIAFNLPRNLPHNYNDSDSSMWFNTYIGLAQTYDLFEAQNDTHVFPERFVQLAEASAAIQILQQAFPQIRSIQKQEMSTVLTTRLQPRFQSNALIQNTPFSEALELHETSEQTSGYVRSGIIKQAMVKLLNQTTELADVTRDELLQSVNAERAKLDIAPLRYNKKLEAAAQAFSHDLWKRGYFSHFTPEGESFVDRIRKAGYMQPEPGECICQEGIKYCQCLPKFSVGENIAKGQFTVKQVMNEWMNSPPHRKNILQPQFTEVGFGLYGTVWVQNFGQIRFD